MMLALLLLLSVQIGGVLGIYGGCMSYSTTVESSGILKVKLFFLNGWQIGKGPCYHCKAEDKGKDVTERRKQFILQNGDPNILGKWTIEMENQNGNVSNINKTSDINRVSKDVVLIVSEKERWELDGSEISLDFNSTLNQFDITFTGAIDDEMKLLPNIKIIHLQVKINPGIRSDTHKPNTSPVVLVKPLYSLELGKPYKIHLTSVDNDGDAVRCEIAQFIEGLGIGPFLSNLTKLGFFSLDRMKCLMNINVDSVYFHENDTFAAEVTVKDYNAIPASIQGTSLMPHIPYKSVIGRVVVLMYFKIMGKTDPPEIIPPTPANNQEYTVYVGGDFHVNVFAKASTGRNIRRFDFLRRDGKPVNHTGIHDASNVSANAVFISTKWSPTIQDIGHHILCANAEDNHGRMTVDLHCFRIIVKEHIFRPRPAVTGKPYFVSFPESLDLTCKKDTYCRFPVYTTTSDPGGIRSIVSTPNSKENVTIQYSQERINGTIECKVAQVEFFASQVGPRRICLNATDSKFSSQRCLFVTVQLPDPCASEPCQHLGRCLAFDDNSGFNCVCTNEYTGILCEKKIKACDRNPCFSNGTCFDDGVNTPPYFFCTCQNGKTGAVCESDIDRCSSNPCSDTEICHPSGQNVCITKKDPVVCPSSSSCQLSTTSVCVKDSNDNPKCMCALGRDSDGTCNTYSSLYMVNSTSPHFVPPTPGLGTTIQCDTGQHDCQFSAFILSSEAAKVSSFGGNKLGTFTVDVTDCVKEGSESVCKAVIKLTKSSNTKLDHTPKEYDLCLNVAKTASPLIFTDKSCVRVMVQPKARGTPTASASCKFAEGTLEKESTIGCKKGVLCHFFVYTSPHSNSSCATMITDNEYVAVYKPLSFSSPGLCRYEVVSTNTTTTGTNKICLKPCLRGESRCFLLNVNDIRDQCLSKPCQNDGACQTLPNGDLKCHCTPQFWGKYCQKGFCDSKTNCNNEAVCYKVNNDVTCLCKLGYTGSTCSFDANKNLTSTNDNGGHFTEMALLERVTCYLNIPCTISFSVTRNIHHMPTLVLGSIDRSLDVSELGLQPLSSSQTVLNGKMVVIGSDLGLKTLCIDSVNTPGNGKTEDEICFKINVINGNSLKPDELEPHFVSPTFPNETIFQCQQHDQCHISLWAKNKIIKKDCPVLKVDRTTEDGVFVFPQANSTNVPCVFDAVVTISNITSLGLCFSLVGDSGTNVDERCYTIHVVRKTSVRGVCAGVSCYNDGFCDARMMNANCRCRSGFSGQNCSTDAGEVQGDKNYYPGSPLFGDLMLPKLIKCPLSKVCAIQFTVSNIDQFNITSNGTYIDTKDLTSSKVVGSRDFSGRVNVIHKRPGTDDFCLFLSSTAGDVYDETCCQIVTDSTTTIDPTDDGEPHFIVPSANNGSEFSCTPGKPCHITLSLNKGSNLKCPEIKHRLGNDALVHIFNSVSSTPTEECVMDIWFGSSATDNGITREHCFQGYVSGVLGEIRCYKVHFEPHVRPPPPTTETSIMVTTQETSSTGVNVQIENATTQGTSGTSDQRATVITQESGTSSGGHVSTSQGSVTSSGGHVSPSQGSGVSSGGQVSTSQGSVTSSVGQVSTTQGSGVSSGGQVSPSQGSVTSSGGHVSPSQGSGVSSGGQVSTSQGSVTSSVGQVSTTQGSGVSSGGQVSPSQGPGVSSGGQVSPSQGSVTSSVGQVSTTQGSGVSSGGQVSPSQGSGVSSAGQVSTSQGSVTSSVGQVSTTQGSGVSSGGQVSPSQGSGVSSGGQVSTSQGSGVSSGGQVSTSQGSGGSSGGQSLSESVTQMASRSAPSAFSVTSDMFTGSNQSPTNYRDITTVSHGTGSHCDIKKVKEKAKNGRVECFCPHPTTGVRTKVIALNPRVSMERLLLAAGLGSGAMITTIGLATVLYIITQKYSSPHKPGPSQKTNKAKKKISVSSISSKGN